MFVVRDHVRITRLNHFSLLQNWASIALRLIYSHTATSENKKEGGEKEEISEINVTSGLVKKKVVKIPGSSVKK